MSLAMLQANQKAFFVHCAKLSQLDHGETQSALWVRAGAGAGIFNTIVGPCALESLNAILAFDPQANFFWWPGSPVDSGRGTPGPSFRGVEFTRERFSPHLYRPEVEFSVVGEAAGAKQFGGILAEVYGLDPLSLQTFIRLAESPCECFLAHYHGRLVAVEILFRTNGASSLYGLAVLPEFRSLSVASQLQSYVLEREFARGAQSVYCYCTDDLLPFYARFGGADLGPYPLRFVRF